MAKCRNTPLNRSPVVLVPNYYKAKKCAKKLVCVSVEANVKPIRAKPKYEESRIQIACVMWFKLAYPMYSKSIFAIPNEGKRTIQAGKRDKQLGVLAGTADLFLMVTHKYFSGLFLECKAPKGVQSEAQKAFGIQAVINGYSYQVFRSFDEFKTIIETYLK